MHRWDFNTRFCERCGISQEAVVNARDLLLECPGKVTLDTMLAAPHRPPWTLPGARRNKQGIWEFDPVS